MSPPSKPVVDESGPEVLELAYSAFRDKSHEMTIGYNRDGLKDLLVFRVEVLTIYGKGCLIIGTTQTTDGPKSVNLYVDENDGVELYF